MTSNQPINPVASSQNELSRSLVLSAEVPIGFDRSHGKVDRALNHNRSTPSSLSGKQIFWGGVQLGYLERLIASLLTHLGMNSEANSVNP